MYYQDQKPELTEKYPTLSLKELTKLVGKEWKEIPEELKQNYLNRALKDRQRYQSEINEFMKEK